MSFEEILIVFINILRQYQLAQNFSNIFPLFRDEILKMIPKEIEGLTKEAQVLDQERITKSKSIVF